jgi:hypothetical protein
MKFRKHFETWPEENILSLQVHKITGRTERSFPKAQVLSYQKGMSLNLQHYPYTIFWDKNFDWDCENRNI